MEGVGKRLREERKRLGLSQAELAAAGGVSELSQLRYESDKRTPDAEYLANLMPVGVDAIYVLSGTRMNARSLVEVSPNEREMLRLYRSLPEDLQEKVSGYIDALVDLSIKKNMNRYARKKGGALLKVAEDGTEYPGDQEPPGGKKKKKKAKGKAKR